MQFRRSWASLTTSYAQSNSRRHGLRRARIFPSQLSTRQRPEIEKVLPLFTNCQIDELLSVLHSGRSGRPLLMNSHLNFERCSYPGSKPLAFLDECFVASNDAILERSADDIYRLTNCDLAPKYRAARMLGFCASSRGSPARRFEPELRGRIAVTCIISRQEAAANRCGLWLETAQLRHFRIGFCPNFAYEFTERSPQAVYSWSSSQFDGTLRPRSRQRTELTALDTSIDNAAQQLSRRETICQSS